MAMIYSKIIQIRQAGLRLAMAGRPEGKYTT
jgi:hypothetical protein